MGNHPSPDSRRRKAKGGVWSRFRGWGEGIIGWMLESLVVSKEKTDDERELMRRALLSNESLWLDCSGC